MFDHCLYFNVNRLARAVNRLWDDAYSELELAPAHAFLLRLVLAKPGIIQKDIAHQLSLDKSTVTRFIDKLEKDGYLVRRTRDEDRRMAVFPTTEAKRISARLDEISQEINGAMRTLLGDRTTKDLVALLGRASTGLSWAVTYRSAVCTRKEEDIHRFPFTIFSLVCQSATCTLLTPRPFNKVSNLLMSRDPTTDSSSFTST